MTEDKAKTNNKTNKWIPLLISVGVVLVFGAGVRVFYSSPSDPVTPAQSVSPRGADPVVPCTSTKDCGPGQECVVPGVCSRQCKADTDCPEGRTCAQLRAMESEREPSLNPRTVTTCVVAIPR